VTHVSHMTHGPMIRSSNPPGDGHQSNQHDVPGSLGKRSWRGLRGRSDHWGMATRGNRFGPVRFAALAESTRTRIRAKCGARRQRVASVEFGARRSKQSDNSPRFTVDPIAPREPRGTHWSTAHGAGTPALVAHNIPRTRGCFMQSRLPFPSQEPTGLSRTAQALLAGRHRSKTLWACEPLINLTPVPLLVLSHLTGLGHRRQNWLSFTRANSRKSGSSLR